MLRVWEYFDTQGYNNYTSCNLIPLTCLSSSSSLAPASASYCMSLLYIACTWVRWAGVTCTIAWSCKTQGSFSVLRRVNRYLKAIVSEGMLAVLKMVSAHYSDVKQLNTGDVVRCFIQTCLYIKTPDLQLRDL